MTTFTINHTSTAKNAGIAREHDLCAYMGINSALELVKNTGNQPVPLHLRNAPTQLMAELGYSDGYKYAHDYPGNFVEQQFLPDTLKDKRLWHAQHTPSEEKLYQRMIQCWGKRFED
jgi:putative ATPase